MPIYEYQCGECRHKFEIRQHFNDEPVNVCPQCGGKCRRVIHATPAIYKASFYGTLSRSGDGAPGQTYTSGEDFFDRSGISREETNKRRKDDAILREDLNKAGIGPDS